MGGYSINRILWFKIVSKPIFNSEILGGKASIYGSFTEKEFVKNDS